MSLTRQRGVDARSPGGRAPYVLVCDAPKQSAAAWVDGQAALRARDAPPPCVRAQLRSLPRTHKASAPRTTRTVLPTKKILRVLERVTCDT